MCLFLSSTKTVIILLARAAVISDDKVPSQQPSPKTERLHRKITTLKILTVKICIYWSLLKLVKPIMIIISLAPRQSLSGKVNVNSHFYTVQHLLYNKKIFSGGSPTCSTTISGLSLLTHGSAAVRPRRHQGERPNTAARSSAVHLVTLSGIPASGINFQVCHWDNNINSIP